MGQILSVKLHTEQQCLWPQAVIQRGSLEGCMYKHQFSIQTEMYLIVRHSSQSRSVRTIPCGKKETKAFKLRQVASRDFWVIFFSSDYADSVPLGCI